MTEPSSDARRKFYVLDTDDALEVILSAPRYEGLNIELTNGYEWTDYRRWSNNVMENARPGDFVVVDMVDKAWSAAQDFIRDKMSGMDKEKAMFKAIGEKKTGWDLFGEGLDWSAVNATYDAFLKPLLLRCKAHVILVSEEKEIPDAPKKPGAKDIGKTDRVQFGKFKPAGQKSLGYQVRTMLRLERKNIGRTITTLGDRERTELVGEVYEDFFTTYLEKVAGWSKGQLTLSQPNSFREKLLIFGPPKVGKSTSWISIAVAARDAERGDS